MVNLNLETIIDRQMFDRIKKYFDSKEEFDVGRREFLKKAGALGAGVAFGGVSLDALASSYDPDYKLPGAVAAEPNWDLRDIWYVWHNRGGGRDGFHADAMINAPKRIRWGSLPREVYERSHVYYILEAKFGRSGQSTGFARDWLVPNNPGLGVFRNGCMFFFTDKKYRTARSSFANGIFFSANFNDREKQALAQMTNYQPLRENLNDHVKFNWTLRDYFIDASVNDKERVLQVIESKKLDKKDELNVYWNLGLFMLSEYQMKNYNFVREQLKDNSFYDKNRKKFNFETCSRGFI